MENHNARPTNPIRSQYPPRVPWPNVPSEIRFETWGSALAIVAMRMVAGADIGPKCTQTGYGRRYPALWRHAPTPRRHPQDSVHTTHTYAAQWHSAPIPPRVQRTVCGLAAVCAFAWGWLAQSGPPNPQSPG